MKKYLFYHLVFLGFLIVSCSSSKIASSWQKPGFENKDYKTILVMAILNPDSKWSFRQSLEDHMANDLKAKNVHDKGQESSYVPGYLRNPTQDDYYMCWWDYYSSVKSRVCTPGYYIQDTKYYWESNIYVGPSKELIYSAKSDSFDPGSTDQLAHEYGQSIVKDIKKKKLLH